MVVRLAALLPLFASCRNEDLARDDGGSNDGGCSEISIADGSLPLFQQSCGGTATASGTSPLGAFSAGTVRVTYHCGAIFLAMSDATGYARLTFTFPYAAEAGAAGALGERSAGVTFNGPPRGDPLVQTMGAVTIAAISDPFPQPDAGAWWGLVEGTFVVESECLSITGSFSSPYCSYDNLCG